MVLSDQVDYLRAQLARAQNAPAWQPPTELPPISDSRRLWKTDEEEDIELAAEMGYLDDRQKLEALAMAQIKSATVDRPE